MEAIIIFTTILATWTIVGTFGWASWAVKVQDHEIIEFEKVDSAWQWFWGGPCIWLLRLVCYMVQRSSVPLS